MSITPNPTEAAAMKLHRLFRLIKPRPHIRNSYAVCATLIGISLRPGSDMATLSKALGLPGATVHNHLQILIRDGLACPNKQQHRSGGSSVLKSFPTLTPAGRAAVEKITALVA